MSHFSLSFFFTKMGQPRPLFNLFPSFQTHITIFTTNKCEQMSIQYMVPGFELATFGTRGSPHNHQTRALALVSHYKSKRSYVPLKQCVFGNKQITVCNPLALFMGFSPVETMHHSSEFIGRKHIRNSSGQSCKQIMIVICKSKFLSTINLPR